MLELLRTEQGRPVDAGGSPRDCSLSAREEGGVG